jgi:hypothetical protein
MNDEDLGYDEGELDAQITTHLPGQQDGLLPQTLRMTPSSMLAMLLSRQAQDKQVSVNVSGCLANIRVVQCSVQRIGNLVCSQDATITMEKRR